MTEYKHITVMSLYGRKGTKLNKCLCKAHVCGVVMVSVLLLSERTKMSAVIRGLYDEVVFVMVSLWSSALVSVCLTKFAHKMQSTAGAGNPRPDLLLATRNQLLHFIVFGVICKMLTTFIPCSDNTSFKSAWQN